MNRRYVKRLVIVCIVLLIIFGGIFGFNAAKFIFMQSFLKHFAFPPAVVKAHVVKSQNWQPTFSSIGEVLGSQDVQVTTEVSGILKQYFVQSGQHVRKGQKIVSIDHSVESAQLKQALASAELAKIQYNRALKLRQTGANSQSDLDSAIAKWKEDLAQVKTDRASIAEHIIRAPFSGVIGIMPTNVGQYINVGTDLGTLTQTQKMYVTFPVTQQELSHIKVGTPFTFTVDTYPNTVYHSRVKVIDSGISSKTQAIDVRGIVLNSDKQHPLVSGMMIHVNIFLPKLHHVVVVPQMSVVETLYGTSVYVIKTRRSQKGKKEQYVHQVFVTVGPSQGDQTVLLKGVHPGDKVVTAGQLKLQDGRTVSVQGSENSTQGAQ